jgi:hypothetical protein
MISIAAQRRNCLRRSELSRAVIAALQQTIHARVQGAAHQNFDLASSTAMAIIVSMDL